MPTRLRPSREVDTKTAFLGGDVGGVRSREMGRQQQRPPFSALAEDALAGGVFQVDIDDSKTMHFRMKDLERVMQDIAA
jgi:hypothetical protein